MRSHQAGGKSFTSISAEQRQPAEPGERATIVEPGHALIGQNLGHYVITGKLGEGGMGVVYEARDTHLDRLIALKLLPHDAIANPARRQRFIQEAKAASALNHPNIVTIYDIASAGGVDYISMELIRGRTLEQLLNRGPLRLTEALAYATQIADALAAAHAAGIIHRDLKPGNIMVTERGDIKILDFGLAKLSDTGGTTEQDETRTAHAITEEGSVVGSAPYMSPEQAEGRQVDARSDIFSFGSVLYEMLTGKRAFEGANRTATMAAILKDKPELPSKLVPQLPREIERIVARCLRKDLGRRSQSMAEIRIELQDLKEESDSGSLHPAASTPAATPRRARWPVFAAIAAVAIAATAAALWSLRTDRTAPPLHATVLTSFVGAHSGPTLSPGRRSIRTRTGCRPDAKWLLWAQGDHPGGQDGGNRGKRPFEKTRGGPPNAGMVTTSAPTGTEGSLTYAMNWPSGDQDGNRAPTGSCVSCSGVPLPTRLT